MDVIDRMADEEWRSPPKRSRDIGGDNDKQIKDGEADVNGIIHTFSTGVLIYSDDEDVGPMPVEDAPKKKRRGAAVICKVFLTIVLPHEKAYLDRLPSSARYTKSFMHRDALAYVTVTPFTDFVITSSVDGVVKFWKKQAIGIEFVKQYRAHLGPVSCITVSADGSLFVSASNDKTVKIFDVVNFGSH